jgi:hypothetical protein
MTQFVFVGVFSWIDCDFVSEFATGETNQVPNAERASLTFDLERSPALLARSQEEPTYLIELTSERTESSRLFSRGAMLPGRELPGVCESRDPATPAPAYSVDSSSLQREKRGCDSNGGR